MLGYFKLFENAWFQRRKGTLEQGQWQGYDAFVRMVFGATGGKTVVADAKRILCPGIS